MRGFWRRERKIAILTHYYEERNTIIHSLISSPPLFSTMTFIAKLAFFLLSAQVALGFVPVHQSASSKVSLEASSKPLSDRFSQFVIATTAVVATSPLAALAEEVDDYEYGAVDAPIGIAVGLGIVAILTAAVPVFMQGGEEAFNEMKERDSGNWGSGQTDALSKKKKR